MRFGFTEPASEVGAGHQSAQEPVPGPGKWDGDFVNVCNTALMRGASQSLLLVRYLVGEAADGGSTAHTSLDLFSVD